MPYTRRVKVLTLDFDGFDWDAGNLKKAQKHGLRIAEIEAFFGQDLLVLSATKHSAKEERFVVAGRSKTGRPLFVAYTWRTRESGRLIRVISARPMHAKESRLYENLKKNIQKK